MLGYIECFIIFLLIYIFIFNKFLKGKSKQDIFEFSGMYLYLFLVLCVTILPIDFTLYLRLKNSSTDFVYIHLKPFNDIISGYGGAVEQIILNIVMTIPFGFLYTVLKPDKGIVRVILATFLLSFMIEVIQLIMTLFLLHHRSCDVTDLITNTIGGIIGFIIYKISTFLGNKNASRGRI